MKGKEIDIGMVLSKYNYNTGSSCFGEAMTKLIGYNNNNIMIIYNMFFSINNIN